MWGRAVGRSCRSSTGSRREAPAQGSRGGTQSPPCLRESNDSYRRLKVAPVQQNSEIIVQDGQITSWVNYFPADEIARIEQACATPEGRSQFIEQAKAQMARVTGASTSGTR